MRPGWRIAHSADRELAAVARESQGGWTDELLDRALSASRITAASLVGGTVSQTKAGSNGEAAGGRIVSAGPGLLDPIIPGRRRQLTLSSAVTAQELRDELARLPETASAGRRRQIETLADALSTFTAARYGSSAKRESAALDEALSAATSVSRKLRSERLWSRPPVRARSAAAMVQKT